MSGIEVVGDRFGFPILILVFILISVFVTMVNAYGGYHFYFHTKICLVSVAVESGGLRGCGYAQKRCEQGVPDPGRLHAGENVHVYNLPSTLIAADGTALFPKVKKPGFASPERHFFQPMS